MNTLPRRFASDPDLPRPTSYSRSFKQKIGALVRGRFGRIALPCLTLLLGLLLGVGGTLWYFSSVDSNRRLETPAAKPVQKNAIVVMLSEQYLTGVITRNLGTSGIPGAITHVHLSLTHGDLLTITGDDEVSAFGFSMSRQFTVVAQTTVLACQPHIHILSAEVGQVPITGTVSSFEGEINHGLLVNSTTLPEGFTYCTINVRTEPQGLFATFAARPNS